MFQPESEGEFSTEFAPWQRGGTLTVFHDIDVSSWIEAVCLFVALVAILVVSIRQRDRALRWIAAGLSLILTKYVVMFSMLVSDSDIFIHEDRATELIFHGINWLSALGWLFVAIWAVKRWRGDSPPPTVQA